MIVPSKRNTGHRLRRWPNIETELNELKQNWVNWNRIGCLLGIEPFPYFKNGTLPRLNLHSSKYDQKNRQYLSHKTALINKTTDSSYGIFLECQDE